MAHLCKDANGHLLKTSGGHLVKETPSCPSDGYCETICADIYYVTVSTGQCDTEDCSGAYTLGFVVSCIWSGVIGADCAAVVLCTLEDDQFSWYFSVGISPNPICRYVRTAYGKCPLGVYLLDVPADCADCDDSVTITATP